jgi:outer membrane protein OmpA-like peptidoglycan-associated protein
MNERISITDKKPEAKSRNAVPQIRRKTESFQTMNSPVDRILFLQRTIGNQAVGKLLKSGALQARLRIGQPGDIYEQEADRVAEQVMRMPDVAEAKDIKIQRKCPKCQNGLRGLPGKDKEDEKLQAKENRGETPEVTSQIESNINALKGSGQPLPESTRAFFEPRFGQDFSQVRVHTDEKAAQSSRAVNAQAYTVGKNIVFGTGQYESQTTPGKRLLAHELTHTIQQSKNRVSDIQTTDLEINDQSKTPEGLQRKADESFVPAGLPCVTDAVPGNKEGINLTRIDVNTSNLTGQHKKQIADFYKQWVAGGSKDFVAIEGYASVDGPKDFKQRQNLNWKLSCDRAEATQAELLKLGLPRTLLITIAHGETDNFSSTILAENRRVVISTVHLPTPPPEPKKIPNFFEIATVSPGEVTPGGKIKEPQIKTTPKFFESLTPSNEQKPPETNYSLVFQFGPLISSPGSPPPHGSCEGSSLTIGGKYNWEGVAIGKRVTLLGEPELDVNTFPFLCGKSPSTTMQSNVIKLSIIKDVFELSLQGFFGLKDNWIEKWGLTGGGGTELDYKFGCTKAGKFRISSKLFGSLTWTWIQGTPDTMTTSGLIGIKLEVPDNCDK